MDLLDLLLNPTKANRRYSPLTSGLTEGQANELRFVFGRVREGEHRDQVQGEPSYASYDEAICQAYASDLATLPGSIDKLIKRTPGAVVMPKTRADLFELVRFAQSNSVPITPRGGGTGFHGGAVPAEGGVVADMRGFADIPEIDEENQRVRVQAGVTWLDLEEHLARYDLALRAHPITAPMSTVGGWVATGGGGFGSHRYGTVRDMLVEATVATPDGELVTRTGDELDLVEGCLGATGLITEIVLAVRKARELAPTGIAFDTLEDAQAMVNRLQGLDAFSVHLYGPAFIELHQEALGGRNLPRKKVLVVAVFEDQVPEQLAEVAQATGGELDETAGAFAWEHRFNHMNFKQFGPSLAQAQAIVPADRLAEAWQAAQEQLEAPEWGIWAVAVADDAYMVQVSILADERLPNHPMAFGNARAFQDALEDHGGHAVAPGLLDAGQAKRILGKQRLKRIQAWKKEHDPQEIMNPGKVLSARVKGLPVVRLSTALAPGLGVFKSTRGGFDHRRGSGPDTSNKALRAAWGRRYSPRLGRLADGIYKCSGMGLTNRAGNLHRGVTYESLKPRVIAHTHRFDTQLPRGVVAAARAILEGAEPGPDVAGHALTLPAVPTYDQRSQNNVPILETIEGVREAGQRFNGLDPSVFDVVQAVETTGNVFGKDQDKRGDWLPGGTPTGVDTTTLLLAGDTTCYQRAEDGAAAFNVLTNAGFAFTTLGPKETHPGTSLYRLGAFQAAAEATETLAEAARDHLGGTLPATVLTLSNEDADVLRRRVGDLLEGSELAWMPRVVTLPQVLDALLSAGRLAFQAEEATGDDAGQDGEADADDEEAQDEESAEEADDQEEPSADEADAEDAGAEEETADDEAGQAEEEAVDVTLIHSPFATDEDREAFENVAQALPGVNVHELDDTGLLLPDLSFHLTEPATAEELTSAFEERITGTALVACTDLAHLFKQVRIDVATLQEMVATRMAVREGAGATLDIAAGDEEEDAFKEFDIPEGAHRVELVKQQAAIPVFPDESILDKAEELGFEDLPFDCRAGSCVTCSARWEGAEPDQSEAQAISEEEQKSHCLTCITKPKGDLKIWTGEQP